MADLPEDAVSEIFQLAFDLSPDAVSLASPESNSEVRILRVNEAFCTLTGYSQEEILGKKSGEIGLWQNEPLRSATITRLINGETVAELNSTIRRRDGSLIPTEISARRITIRGKTLFLAVRRDIRHRLRMLEQLRENKDRWRFAFEGDGGALWDWNLVTGSIYCSGRAMAMLGHNDEPVEIKAAEIVALITPQDIEAIRLNIHRLFKGQIVQARDECTLQLTSGREIFLRYTMRPMRRNSHGRVERIVGTAHDLTQSLERNRKRHLQDEAYAHQGRMLLLGEMASIMAHEVNQPLEVIAGCADLCRRAIDDQGTLEPLLCRMEEQALRAGQIIWRMRDFSRNGPMRHEPLDLVELVQKLVHWFDDMAYQHVSFEITAPKRLPSPIGDRIQIEQVLLNLIRNGIQAMEEVPIAQRKIGIRLAFIPSDNSIVIDVLDRGTGLPEQIALDIIEPFFTTRKTGLGLGLSISQTIVHNHGGKLWCAPRTGGGTIFSFSLPLSGHLD